MEKSTDLEESEREAGSGANRGTRRAQTASPRKGRSLSVAALISVGSLVPLASCDGGGGSDAGAGPVVPASTGGAGGAGGAGPVEPCGGCAVLKVPLASPRFPGAFTIVNAGKGASEPDLFDLSQTKVTLRLWVESDVPGGALEFVIFNPVDVELRRQAIGWKLVDSPREPTELVLDFSTFSELREQAGLGGSAGATPEPEVGGFGGIGGASGTVPPLDLTSIEGLHLLVYGGEPPRGYDGVETRVYIDEIRFDEGPVDDMTFDESSDPLYSFGLIDGADGEVDWIE